jgi:hypothetical protein
MSRIFTLGAIAGAGGSRYWYGGIQGTSTATAITPQINSLIVAPNDDIIIGVNDAASSVTGLYKLSSKGKILWQRDMVGQFAVAGGMVDASNTNLYIAARDDSDGATVNVMSASNPTSTTLARRVLGSGDYGKKVLVDTSGNIYSVSSHIPPNTGTEEGVMVRKYNSAGTIQWTRTIYGSNLYNLIINDACLDLNNDVIICGMFLEMAGGTTDIIDFYVAKINGTSGAVTWTQRLTGTDLQGANEYRGVITDSAGNIFLNGHGHHSTAQPEDDMITVKYNTSGTLQWQRRINMATTTGTEFGRGIVRKSNGSVVVAGRALSTNDVHALVNYDTNGNVVWQRTLTNFDIRAIGIDSKDDLIIAGLTGNYSFFVLKIPSDGSKQGTYSLFGQDVVYANGTGTTITSSFTAVTSPTITNSTATTTATTTPTYTFATISKALTRTSIL